MFFVFTYYNSEVSHFFTKSMRSVLSMVKHKDGINLIIMAEETPSNKVLSSLNSLFGEILVIEHKMFSVERQSDPSNISTFSFMEMLLLYPEYDRLFVDPNVFLINPILIPDDNSLFFRQHNGLLSMKLAFVKAGPQIITAFSAFNLEGGHKILTNQTFTYVISNNFLIQKQLHDKQLINGKLFNSSGIQSLPVSGSIGIDMTGLHQISGDKAHMEVDKIFLTQKPAVLPGIKKKIQTGSLIDTVNSLMVFKKNMETKIMSKINRSRDNLNDIFSKSRKSKIIHERMSSFSDPNRLTILIPVYKNAPVVANCLNSIINSNDSPFNLLVINDSPDDMEVESLLSEFNNVFYEHYRDSDYVFLTNSVNLGFIKTVNLGLSMVGGDVILLNSDTIVSPGWSDRLLAYKKMGKVASVTPLSNSAAQCSFPIPERDQPHYRGLSPDLIDSVFSRLPMNLSHNGPTGVGFCMLMTSEAIKKIGYFDDVNFKVGYGEENDWCWRAVLEGFINIIAPNVYVAHEHGISFAGVKNLSEIRSNNKKALVRKYPNYFSVIASYSNKQHLNQVIPLLKYAIDFEYTRPIKKPVKLILGDIDIPEDIKSDRSVIVMRVFNESFDITCNDFLIGKTTVFVREPNSIQAMISLLNPEKVYMFDAEYMNVPEIKEALSNFDKEIINSSKIIVELPYSGDKSSGGITRMQKLVMELPKYASTSGGIKESLKFVDKFPPDMSVAVRFQRIDQQIPLDLKNWTVGLPDKSFPTCDVCITYSDNPYLDDLVKLPQVKKVLLYMLSYGMAIDRERHNILSKNVTVMCSTKKIEKAIAAEGVKVHRVGFALDMKDMYLDDSVNRMNYLAIMYHPSQDKRYPTAVTIANDLFRRKKIDGVITFGTQAGYDAAIKPVGLVKHYPNADRDQIREIFNTCKCFLMPSVTEGLNLTPIESTLCGCPAVICDGAIDEIFIPNDNCFFAEKDDLFDLVNKCTNVLDNFNKLSKPFRKSMQRIVDGYTWDKVIKNIMSLV